MNADLSLIIIRSVGHVLVVCMGAAVFVLAFFIIEFARESSRTGRNIDDERGEK